MTDRGHPIVVLGAGLCGLSAAYHLEQHHRVDYVLLERHREVGGLARTVSVSGFAFDHAIHVLFSRDPEATRLICDTLLPGNLRRAPRRAYCWTADRYVEYPYQLNNRGLPPRVIVDNALGVIWARFAQRWRRRPPLDFEAWIHRTFGRGIARHFMIPYNRRQWAWDLRDMSYDWIADRVAVPRISEVIRGVFRPQPEAYGPNREFWYPLEGGIQALPRAFLGHIDPERVWTRAVVAEIDPARRELALADGRRLRYRGLISTIPLPELVRLLGSAVPPAIRHRAAALRGNAVHTVNIGLEGDLPGLGPVHWIYFPEDATVFHRASFPGNFSPWMVPAGCSSIQLEVSESPRRPCDRSTLVQQGLDGLVRAAILSERDARPADRGGRVRVSAVVSLDPAYVIHDLAHGDHTRAIKAWLERLDISMSGRFGEWEYLNMDQAILHGRAAAAVRAC